MTSLAKSALWYAGHGWHIFPLRPKTKDPFSDLGVYNATTDAQKITTWWKRWPDANIGLHCGASGLLVMDMDSYKEQYSGEELLAREHRQTITNLTGGGGEHLIYKMPQGKQYGNATGNLPPGIDIRGYGGYIVLPPSVHPNGSRYIWEEGFGPHEVRPLPLPDSICAILDEASTPIVEVFFKNILSSPDLSKWKLSQLIEACITGDRSRIDQAIITALVAAGATDDEIWAVFKFFPTTGKYADKNGTGDKYLAHSIGKARGYLQQQGPASAIESAPGQYAKANQVYRERRVKNGN